MTDGGERFADPHGTVFIDTAADSGAWAEAIANTPHLARQCAADPLETYERPAPDDRAGEDRSNLND